MRSPMPPGTPRKQLAARSLQAEQQSPYIDIFSQGIDHYTGSHLDLEHERYAELSERLEAHLPASDAVRKTTVAKLAEGLRTFDEGVVAVALARRNRALAATELDHADRRVHGLDDVPLPVGAGKKPAGPGPREVVDQKTVDLLEERRPSPRW